MRRATHGIPSENDRQIASDENRMVTPMPRAYIGRYGASDGKSTRYLKLVKRPSIQAGERPLEPLLELDCVLTAEVELGDPQVDPANPFGVAFWHADSDPITPGKCAVQQLVFPGQRIQKLRRRRIVEHCRGGLPGGQRLLHIRDTGKYLELRLREHRLQLVR